MFTVHLKASVKKNNLGNYSISRQDLKGKRAMICSLLNKLYPYYALNEVYIL